MEVSRHEVWSQYTLLHYEFILEFIYRYISETLVMLAEGTTRLVSVDVLKKLR